MHLIDGDRAAVFWRFAGTCAARSSASWVRARASSSAARPSTGFADGAIQNVRHTYDFSGMLVKTGVLKVKPAT